MSAGSGSPLVAEFFAGEVNVGPERQPFSIYADFFEQTE